MVERFPQDCWDKGCPHFKVDEDDREEVVCRCLLSKDLRCYLREERASTKLCPRIGQNSERSAESHD